MPPAIIENQNSVMYRSRAGSVNIVQFPAGGGTFLNCIFSFSQCQCLRRVSFLFRQERHERSRPRRGAEILLPQEQAPSPWILSRSALSQDCKMFRCGIGCSNDTERATGSNDYCRTVHELSAVTRRKKSKNRRSLPAAQLEEKRKGKMKN